MKNKRAMITWSRAENQWVLRLETDDGWEFSKAWYTKEPDQYDVGWVHESIILEIANLQELGYYVIVMP